MPSIKAKKIDEKIAEEFSKIKINSIGEIYIGENKIAKCRNKWTRYFMSVILLAICNGTRKVEEAFARYRYQSIGNGATCRIGIDTTTSTTPSMSDLVNKVDVAPDSITRRLIKEPDYTLYIAEFVFAWNAGTLPDIYEGATAEGDIDGRVGEFGVYLETDNDDWETGITNPNRYTIIYAGTECQVRIGNDSAVRLASRIASADDAFDAFEFYGSIDPLTFKWRFQVAIL